jgi:Spy/CpxP family protein refolding chaperone
MKIHCATVATRTLAASLLLAGSLSAFAAPPADGDPHFNCAGPDSHFRGPPPGPPQGPRFGAFPGEGWGGPPPFLRGLHLTEEQQDKVFAIVHAAAPALRDQEKALRKAREALRDLNESTQYEESRVKGLADTAAKADSQLTVLRARTEHEIRAVLTPEQLKDLQEHRREHGPRDHDGPPPV